MFQLPSALHGARFLYIMHIHPLIIVAQRVSVGHKRRCPFGWCFLQQNASEPPPSKKLRTTRFRHVCSQNQDPRTSIAHALWLDVHFLNVTQKQKHRMLRWLNNGALLCSNLFQRRALHGYPCTNCYPRLVHWATTSSLFWVNVFPPNSLQSKYVEGRSPNKLAPSSFFH